MSTFTMPAAVLSNQHPTKSAFYSNPPKKRQKQPMMQQRRQSTSVSEIDCRPAVIRGMFNDPMP
jgi:hypothetical protein